MEASQEQFMRPIWYFVGLILMIIGGIVFLSGIYNIFYEVPNTSVLNLHANIWWGAFLLIVGIVYTLTNKNARVR